nr:hypothetical protein [Alphaproteobacteria bacterium]
MSVESTLLTMLNLINKTALAILILSGSQFKAYGSDEIAAPPHMSKFREQLGSEYVKLEKCIENYQSQLTDIKDSNGQRRLKVSKALHLNLLLDETNHELKKFKGQIRSYDKMNATFPFERLPKGVRGLVVKYLAADYISAGKRFNELEDVNRNNRRWKSELREFVN